MTIEAYNAAHREQLQARAEREIRGRLIASLGTFDEEVARKLDGLFVVALHEFYKQPGPEQANNLLRAMNRVADRAVREYVAREWEPQDARGCYLALQVPVKFAEVA